MASNNDYDETINAPQYATEDEILASFGYKQVHILSCFCLHDNNIIYKKEMNKTMSTISNFSIAFGCCSILSGLTPVTYACVLYFICFSNTVLLDVG
jgi:hypothetical protein